MLNIIDKKTYKAYENSLEEPKEIKSLQKFVEFLNKRIINLEAFDNYYANRHSRMRDKDANYSEDSDTNHSENGDSSEQEIEDNHDIA